MYSGITDKHLASATITLGDAQDAFLRIVGEKTILVGHSAECDLRALKIIHDNVLDTAVRTSRNGRKRSLKSLAEEYLGEVR